MQFDSSMHLLIQSQRKRAFLALIIPPFRPRAGAQGVVGNVELTAGLEILAFGKNALVIIDIVLPAMLRLILVGKASVEPGSHKFERHGYTLLVFSHDWRYS